MTGVVVAAAMAVLAAVLFAFAAAGQNDAVAEVVGRAHPSPSSVPSPSPSSVAVGRREWRALVRSRAWLAAVSLNAVAAVVHAGALVLAPVAVVQPIGVLSVPFAVVIAARAGRERPPAAVLVAVGVCLTAVAGFVTLANAQLDTAPSPLFVGVVTAALTAGAVSAVLAVWATRCAGWVRCVAFAAAGATAFGLVSALMRLVAIRLSSGVDALAGVGVWAPAAGIAAALVLGGWAVQQAHAAGAPTVVLGCMTVIDPLVAVVLGATMLGEGGSPSVGATAGLVGFAALALSSALLLAQRHPAARPVPGAVSGAAGAAAPPPRR